MVRCCAAVWLVVVSSIETDVAITVAAFFVSTRAFWHAQFSVSLLQSLMVDAYEVAQLPAPAAPHAKDKRPRFSAIVAYVSRAPAC